MLRNPAQKYKAFPPLNLPDRQWPNRHISTPPRWLSTDLRDGNQSLIDPMNAEKKERFFNLLIKMGLKEIEVGFPSAGATEFNFIKGLVESGSIPDDVLIQSLTQARSDLITTTFEAMAGAHSAIVHLYNAISPAWREIVFRLDQNGVRQIAVNGAKMLRDNAARFPDTNWLFEYSPETFSTAELDVSLDVCSAVMDILQPTKERPLILNLPATVEAATPNIYADQIEYFIRNIPRRDTVIISIHPHNDRGTGVAAAELGIMAGADRVEGCLFGNGERTGNVDLVTLGLNLYTQGVDPGLDFSNMDEIVQTVEYCNQLPVPVRHPYAGELVFTAFSGSHQDAIKKGFDAQNARNDAYWNVPYLPLDPKDIGRDYEAVIRVNSQSGKGGVAWVLQQDHGLRLPKKLQADFSLTVQRLADESSRELTANDIWEAFSTRYHLDGSGRYRLIKFTESRVSGQGTRHNFIGKIAGPQGEFTVSGEGTGLISSVLNGFIKKEGTALHVVDFQEHALSTGRDAQAAAYLHCQDDNGNEFFGVGIHNDVATASVKAALSALSRI